MNIIEYLTKHISDLLVILGAVGIVFEVTPIKINPFSTILKWIGKRINSDINDKIDAVKGDLDEVKWELYHSKKKQSRILISNFANDLRHGEKKTESQYIAIMDMVREYLANNWNSKVKMEALFIEGAYKKYLRKQGNDKNDESSSE